MFLVVLVIALGVGTIYGLLGDGFRALEHVWSVAGPFAGAISTYYFHRERRESG
jgi:type IV secretory pathway VirB2 component (pilin)